MKTKLILIVILIHSGVILTGQNNDAKEVLLKSSYALKEHNMFNYEAKFRIKKFDSSDTSGIIDYKCTILKAPTDTILGYYARIYNKDEERIYDGFNVLLIWHNQKQIVKDNPHISGRNFANNNIKRECIPNFLYSGNPYNYYISEARGMKLSEVSIDNNKVWKIEISLPTDEEITFFKRIVYLDQDSFYPVRIESFAKYKNIQDEYSELILKNIVGLNNSDNNFLNFYKYPEGYDAEIFKEPTISYELLANGTAFIPFVGVDLNGHDHLLTSDNITGNLILIDFWYLGCPPCLRAMPELAKISKKYKKQGLTILGLDSFDGPNKREEIKMFAKKLGVEYTLLNVDTTLSEKYKAKSYPTIYLIKTGVIIYSQIGYTEEKMKELENIIILNLKN
jgi:thiol-disulfide isomerase/thioredoxin